MEEYILLTIGFLCILISIIFIFKGDNIIKLQYEDTVKKYKEINEYVNTIERLVEDLDELVSKSLLKIDLVNNNNKQNSLIINNSKNLNKSINDVNILEENREDEINNNFYNEIFTLKKLGYKNDVIAKKLNKGIREIEIILKMNGYFDY